MASHMYPPMRLRRIKQKFTPFALLWYFPLSARITFRVTDREILGIFFEEKGYTILFTDNIIES